MSDKIPAGINTTKGQFDYVFSPATQNALADLLDIDYRQISVEKSPEVTKRSVTGAKVIISTWGALPYTSDLLDCCPDLELVLYGAGSFKAYLSKELTDSDVKVCTAVHMNALPVAEFTLGLILTSMKNVFRHSREFESDGRSGWKKSRPYSGGYYHTKVGLLGYGRITKFLLDLLTKFDFDVLVADDFVTADELAVYGAQKADVAEVMSTCEVISIHHADVERNWNIINKETLALMKPGVRLINTSRGRMINEADLVEKLREGSITAFLDVTYPEPPADGHPFYELQNCILTPHVAGSVGTEVFRMGDYCLRELTNWIEGKPLENQIDIGDLANRA